MDKASDRIPPDHESRLRLGEPTPFSFPVGEERSLPNPGRCNWSNLGVGVPVGDWTTCFDLTLDKVSNSLRKGGGLSLPH